MNKIILFLFSVFSFQILGLSPFLVDGGSMEPTLHNGDVILISKYINKFDRGDVVVFSDSLDLDYLYIKRIIGLPNEKIHIKKDGIFVEDQNGIIEKLDENYLVESLDSLPITEKYKENYHRVYDIPSGKYFVLGDNRLHSLDSRYFKDPFVIFDNIKGKYLLKIFEYE